MRRCCIESPARWIGAIAALFACSGLVAAPLDAERALRTSQAAVGRPIGDYTLAASDGRQVRLSGYRGKPLLVNFVYTGCSQVCPTAVQFLARAVRQARDTLGPDAFNVATIGFNQPFDSPQAMHAFARQHGLGTDHWDFLSPAQSDVPALTRDFGFVFEPTAGGFDHLTQLTVVDGEGRVVRQIYGESFELPMLVLPLREMIAGSPLTQPTLGTLLDRVRILCTVYDPASGRYRLNYGLFIEILAGLSVIGGVAAYLLKEWRRQRRSAPAAARRARLPC